ncbi:MAG: hypothetical protein IH942_07935 [Acidobacteria bacterium]|nr:hypothetical protein [Acidobacteriota bacterium]
MGRTDRGGLRLLGDNGCHDIVLDNGHDIVLDNGDDSALVHYDGDSVLCDDHHNDAPVARG